MGGGLMQLVAYGAQDIYLTGNPQITFFKVVYRRHTNFSMECIQQTVAGTSTLSTGTTSGDVTISRNGDLVSGVYVTSAKAGITDGSSLIASVDLEIGGQLIDRHFKEWNQVWQELTTPAAKQDGLKYMQNSFTHGHTQTGQINSIGMVQIPLYFWFCRNPGLALPLIALQYHEVKLKFTWGTSTEAGTAAACKVWADYIYLDTDERRRFAQVSHEYLIEQLQKDTFAGTGTTENLNFNHPVKELIWTSAATNAYVDAKLVLNGHDRFEPQEEEYFQLRQPYQYHTNVPGYNILYHEHTNVHGTIDTGITTKNSTVAAAAANYTTGNTIIFSIDTAAIPEIGDNLQITAIDNSDKKDRTSYSSYVTNRVDTATEATITVHRTITSDNIPAAYANTDSLEILITGGHRTPLPNVSNLEKKINVYSFALKPEEHQPSGTCNFSRIDNAQLMFNTANGSAFNIYAVNYNVLRIMSGMGGLAYSN
jgi:hypothetical protein